jgi:AraC family transcriptional regulator of adaptative response/methylated-DNA-[protein]-cysteine methyltransferase
MLTLPSQDKMYQALLDRDGCYDGVFYIAVKTTGIFCRPICPARKPLRKNVEFFAEPKEAVYAGYRPCKRCKPLDRVQQMPDWVRKATSLAEALPEERVTEYQLREAGISPDRLRRWFKTNYGMSFQSYQRGLRLGQAFGQLRKGQSVIETSVDSGWESTSGFRDAFQKAFGTAPRDAAGPMFAMRWIETPLGPMVAIADDSALYLLEFADRPMLASQMKTLHRRYKCSVAPGMNDVLRLLEKELASYFAGELQSFSVPLDARGTEFQCAVWDRLLEIPYGGLLSYGEMARDLDRAGAQRAVGKANGDNRLAILIPCHRVVRSDGSLCGYGGGLWRKKRLLEIEQGQARLV